MVREVLKERDLSGDLIDKKPAVQKSGQSIPTGKRSCFKTVRLRMAGWEGRKEEEREGRKKGNEGVRKGKGEKRAQVANNVEPCWPQ